MRSPFASAGVAGHTTLSPGMCAKLDSGFWEWKGPPEKPPPDGSRTVLGNGAHPHHRGAGAAAHDRSLGEGRVDHAPGAELLLEALRHLEGASVDADVLADDEDALVALHLGAEAVRNCLQIGLYGHYLWWGVSR